MAVNNLEAEMAFTHAWGLVRNLGMHPGTNVSQADPNAVASAVWRRLQNTPGAVYADARTAALRAIRARELASAIQANPQITRGLTADQYPNAPWINRRNAEYQYRVAVRLSSGTAHTEIMVHVRARSRLTGDEIMARAERSARRGEGAYADYQTEIRRVGTNPTVQLFILSAERNPG